MARKSRKPLTKQEKTDALERAQSLLVVGTSFRDVVRAISGEFGVKWNTAESYVRDARKDWRNAYDDERETKRAEQEAMIRKAIQHAWARRRPRRENGRIVRDEQGRAETDPDPDVRTVIRATSELARLTGTSVHPVEIEASGQLKLVLDSFKAILGDDPEKMAALAAEIRRRRGEGET